MTVDSDRDVEGLKAVGRVVATVLHGMLDALEPGMTTRELDEHRTPCDAFLDSKVYTTTKCFWNIIKFFEFIFIGSIRRKDFKYCTRSDDKIVRKKEGISYERLELGGIDMHGIR